MGPAAREREVASLSSSLADTEFVSTVELSWRKAADRYGLEAIGGSVYTSHTISSAMSLICSRDVARVLNGTAPETRRAAQQLRSYYEDALRVTLSATAQLDFWAQSSSLLLGGSHRQDASDFDKLFSLLSGEPLEGTRKQMPELLQKTKAIVVLFNFDRNQKEGLTKFLDVATSLTIAAVTKDYLGLAQSILGILGTFGSGQATADAQQRQAFAAIFRQLQVISQQLDSIYRQLKHLQRQLLLFRDEVSDDSLYNRRLQLSSGIVVQLNQCDLFLQTRAGFGFRNGSFPTLASAKQHAMFNSLAYAAGRSALEAIFSQRPRFHEVFARQSS